MPSCSCYITGGGEGGSAIGPISDYFITGVNIKTAHAENLRMCKQTTQCMENKHLLHISNKGDEETTHKQATTAGNSSGLILLNHGN